MIGGRVNTALSYLNKELKSKGVKVEEEKKPEPDTSLEGNKINDEIVTL